MSAAGSLATRPAAPDDRASFLRLAVDCFDREPIHRAAIADLLFDRPRQQAALRLVAELDGRVVGFAVGSVPGDVGQVDAIAVEPAARRLGVGTRLLADLEAALARAGATRFKIGENSWYYGWPGVDVTYTAALSLLERAGYRPVKAIHNMDVPLARWIPGTAPDVLRRRGTDVEVRRGTDADWPAVEAFVIDRFTEVWRHEVGLALHRDRPTAFVAYRAGRVVGFACHGVYRTDWFGPIGTDPDERGSGIGEALLRLCLDDMAAAGIALAQIGWIGPMSFYSRTVGACIGREFAVLEKPARPDPSADPQPEVSE